MNPLLPDDPGSKVNVCVENVLKIWEDGKTDRLTQLLFCDLSTPKNDGSFNIYDDSRESCWPQECRKRRLPLSTRPILRSKRKTSLPKSDQDRCGFLGSTQKMGAGTNCQDRLVALHHLDVGWRPSDMTQRNGRIIRQGNQNKEVQIYQYVTESTFDAYLYVRHEAAQN